MSPAGGADQLDVASETTPITQVPAGSAQGLPTGLAELDRVLGGGLLAGSVTLLGGEPGCGKSTLVLQLAAHAAMSGHRALYVSGEESASQVRARAERLQALVDGLWLTAGRRLDHALAQVATLRPELVVVDSVQALSDPALGSAPGSPLQVRAVADALVGRAKAGGPAVVLVGQVTKDGGLAGPRSLEHVVDTVLVLEGDRDRELRLLRCLKHRFGPTGNLGLFEMTEHGMLGICDPSALLLAARRDGSPGSAVAPVIEGNRALMVELQALLVGGVAGTPRRTASGLDTGRLHLLLAVLDRHLGLATAGADVYAATVGGVRISDPGADLALLMAVASAHRQRPVRGGTVVCGEVGLGGEIRRAAGIERRLAEAARLGFDTALVPAGQSVAPVGLELVAVADVTEAARAAGLGERPASSRPP
jgi:DNA repair protein RadA/Sms